PEPPRSGDVSQESSRNLFDGTTERAEHSPGDHHEDDANLFQRSSGETCRVLPGDAVEKSRSHTTGDPSQDDRDDRRPVALLVRLGWSHRANSSLYFPIPLLFSLCGFHREPSVPTFPHPIRKPSIFYQQQSVPDTRAHAQFFSKEVSSEMPRSG